MRMIRPDLAMLSATLTQGLGALKDQNWVRILAATSLLLMVVLWVAVPPMGQAQGANTAPTAVDDNGATAENTAVDINVVANDTDTDGDTLSVTGVTTPTHGTAAIVPGSTTTVTYSPNAGFNGADSFDYTVSDGADTDTGTVTVAIGPPPAKPTGLTATAGDTQIALTWDDQSDSSITRYEYLQAQVAKLTAFDAAAGDSFGDSVAVDGDTMVVSASGYDDDMGAVYVFTRQSGAWTQVVKLTASDGAAGDYFGYSVAVDGDTVVVGAFEAENSTGAAYVFTEPANGAGWAHATEAKLTASDGDDGDEFGVSVAVDGDTVVVGADQNDGQGSTYLFTEPNSGWHDATQTAKLTAFDGDDGDEFGVSVAVDGDTVVVGADQNHHQGTASGSAYVFTEPNGGWADANETAKLTPSDGAANDYFGNSVAVDGDTVVVGAYQNDDPGFDSGSAYLFTKPPTGWESTSTAAKLTASDGAAGDLFGNSVAVDGDTVVVGAFRNDDNGHDSGTAYVFTEPTSGWHDATESVKLTDPDREPDDHFGVSVAMDGDTLVVGAPGESDSGSQSGAAYVYEVGDWTAIPESAAGETNAASYTVTGLINDEEHSFWIRAANGVGSGTASDAVNVIVGPPAKPTGLTATAGDGQATLTWDDPSDSSITGYDYLQAQVAKLTASDGATNDLFGYSVAVAGDTMVVGAEGYDGDKGAAYVFTRQSGEWTQVVKLTASDGAATDSFGHSVAVDGNTLVVGAGWDDDNGYDSGSAYVFTKPASGGWADATETAKLTASDAAAYENFGVSVAVEGDTVVVGSLLNDYRGSAYVFTKPASGGWADATETAKLTASDRVVGDDFGISVAVDGDTVVVGARAHDENGPESGSAYVFTKPANGWTDATETAKLTASDGADYDHFGISVAVDGDTLVVGAFGDEDVYTTRGAAYVFTKPNTGWTDATETAKLAPSDGGLEDGFGVSVAVDGDKVVAGSERRGGVGAAYLFTQPWGTESAKLTASDGAANHFFGYSVAMDGDTAVVGAFWDDDNGPQSGSAYVFEVGDWTAIPDSAAGETNATSYTVTGLINDEEHNFWIRAANSVGSGPPHDGVHVTPTS